MTREVVTFDPEARPKIRCRAHKKSGDQCRRWAIAGGAVCPVHGGSAGQVRRKAAARIEASLDRAALAIVRLMEDPDTPPAIKLAAARDLLDRGDLTGRARLQIDGQAPWQVVLSRIVVDGRGMSSGGVVIDAEVVEDSPSPPDLDH